MRWLILLTTLFAVVASGATIELTYYLDVNPYGPGFEQTHVDAILDYLHSGSGAGVTPTTGPLHFADLMVTNDDYPSWMGTVIGGPGDPGPWGTALYAGVQIVSDTSFLPGDVGVRQTSPNNATANDYWDLWGHWFLTDADINWMRGYDASGNPITGLDYDTPVYELVYVGPSGAFDAPLLNEPYYGLTYTHDQAGLNLAIGWYELNYGVHSVKTCYDLGADSNCDTIDITPEPLSFVLAGAGLLALGLLRRRLA